MRIVQSTALDYREKTIMAGTRKHNLRTVEVNREDFNKKLKNHRRRVGVLVIFVLALLASAAIAAYIYFENKVYTGYDVVSSIKRTDTSAPGFANFQGKLLKYTNDGALYTNLDGGLIWNQTYEMDEPRLEMQGNYVAIYELNGTQVYILDTVNLQGSIKTTMPIQKVSIASQGVVAILMENDGTSYLQVCDRTGNELASGELHVQNSGYPMDIALSEGGEKLAVSMLDISGGSVKTVIAFYNFGTVGQSSIDNIVSSYSYADVVIPRIRYLSQDTMAAFGDDRVILFTGAQKPAEGKTIEPADEVKSIFYDQKHFGLVYDGGSGGKDHRLELYDLSGEQRMKIDFETEYTDIELLANGEICILGEDSCEIFNKKGICKFQHQFQNYLYKVIPGNSQISYTFILEGESQRVKLK